MSNQGGQSPYTRGSDVSGIPNADDLQDPTYTDSSHARRDIPERAPASPPSSPENNS